MGVGEGAARVRDRESRNRRPPSFPQGPEASRRQNKERGEGAGVRLRVIYLVFEHHHFLSLEEGSPKSA